MESSQILKDWLTLDNAAKIYPATSAKRSPAFFRITVTLQEPVKLWKLQEALARMMPRFPYFQVFLHHGLFWYYLQKHQEIPDIKLLKHIGKSDLLIRRRNSHLISVSVRGKTIAVDISHILTDGNGGIRFLVSLTAEYLRLNGINIDKDDNILTPDQRPDPDEFLDAHRFFFKSGIPKPPNLARAFHLPENQSPENDFRIITGKAKVEKILFVCRNKGVSITDYLAAVYIHSLSEIYQNYVRNGLKPDSSLIRLEIPVDMRKFYPARTMRNFSLYVSPEIDLILGNYEFSEILKKVHHSMKIQVDDKELSRHISRNVAAELNPFIRIIPLFMKNLYLSRLYLHLGEKIYSGVLSNLGLISLPEKMTAEIDSFNVLFLPNQIMKKSCCVISYNNIIHINIGSAIKNREFERCFFTRLVEDGIPVLIEEE